MLGLLIVRLHCKAVSFQNDAVGDGKVFIFLFSRWYVFLDDSGGNIGDNGHMFLS